MERDALAKRFAQLHDWETGAVQPTLRQLERYAHATHVPVGFFFLAEPPAEALPLPDFRTLGGGAPALSADLLDVIYACQNRQAWYRDEARVNGDVPWPFVGSLDLGTPTLAAAERIRVALGVAKTLSMYLKIPILQTTSLQLMAVLFGKPCLICMNAFPA